MILRPCQRCRFRGDCEIEDTVRREHLAAGLRVREDPGAPPEFEGMLALDPHHLVPTSVAFTCPVRLRGLEPGARVAVTLESYEALPAPLYGYEVSRGDYDGTVMEAVATKRGSLCDGKLRVWMDEESPQMHRRVIHVYPDQLTPLAYEPPAELCDGCQRPVGDCAGDGSGPETDSGAAGSFVCEHHLGGRGYCAAEEPF